MGCRNCGKKKEEFKALIAEVKTIQETQVPKSEPLIIPLDSEGNMDLLKHFENISNARPTVIAAKKLRELQEQKKEK
jgi:nitrate reductase NapAB chaperone NapD